MAASVSFKDENLEYINIFSNETFVIYNSNIKILNLTENPQILE